ncbi:MAG: serine hydrolase domain-containing protein [Candidatus Vecturithrix sp.]|jgi:CubicO group peptidase (beta-lactamase class C family)|nr:serine hydrolase domain-containing protein [Candidatus Vecturithrix sp.]
MLKQQTVPEEVGLSTERLQRIRPIMQACVDQRQCAGVLTLIARRAQIAHLECFGMMDIEAGKAMQPDTIFRIYSMSKPMTSVAALMLYEEGRFRLHDPVSKFLPPFKNTKVLVKATEAGRLMLEDQERDMTIFDLLTHTSGLSYGFDPLCPIDKLYRKMYKELNILDHEDRLIHPYGVFLADIMSELAKIPLRYQPGTRWHYGLSTDVLGYLVQVISDMPFDEFLQQRIFTPLNMQDTGFYVPTEKVDRFAAMYGPAEQGGLRLIDAPAASPYLQTQSFRSGGGGLVSTAHDYLQFAGMLLNHGEFNGVRLLSRKTVEFMTMNHLSENVLQPEFAAKYPGYGFGLGVRMVRNVAQTGHIGSEGMFSWGGAAGTDFWVDPNEELIAIIMPQQLWDPSLKISLDFRVLTYQAILD